MAVKIFIFALLVISSVSYFMPVNNMKSSNEKEDMPMLEFKNSTMYTLSEIGLTRIVDAKLVQRYETKDIMYNGIITLKNTTKEKESFLDTLYADIIIKKSDDYKFIDNVKFKRADFLTLNTNELNYNTKTFIATNSVPFDGTYYNNYIKGTNLYFDRKNYLLKSKNAHFELEVEKK